MFSKASTSSPGTRASSVSGSKTPTINDRLENGRSPSESAATAHGDSRPVESHWESVIDRATD
jgi:hypothetical protein